MIIGLVPVFIVTVFNFVHCEITARESIPGRPGFPSFFHSRFPGIEKTDSREKTGIAALARDC